jgi:hypothetical protein
METSEEKVRRLEEEKRQLIERIERLEQQNKKFQIVMKYSTKINFSQLKRTRKWKLKNDIKGVIKQLNEQLVSYNISITRLAIALNRENLEPILEFQNENKSYSDDFNLYYKDVLGLSDATLYNIKKKKKQTKC